MPGQTPFAGSDQEFFNTPAVGNKATVTITPPSNMSVVLSSIKWIASPTANTGALTGTADLYEGATKVFSVPCNVVAGALVPVEIKIEGFEYVFAQGAAVKIEFSAAGNGTLQEGVSGIGYFT